MGLRGDDTLRIQHRLSHADFDTAQIYIREAQALGPDVGEPFPPLPASLLSDRSDPGPESLGGEAEKSQPVGTTKESLAGWTGLENETISITCGVSAEPPRKLDSEPPRSKRANSATPGHAGKTVAELDPVEVALAEAIAKAAAAGQWAVVSQLATELSARRTTPAAPKAALVVLEAERRRRDAGRR
jgi:hypothetical protein